MQPRAQNCTSPSGFTVDHHTAYLLNKKTARESNTEFGNLVAWKVGGWLGINLQSMDCMCRIGVPNNKLFGITLNYYEIGYFNFAWTAWYWVTMWPFQSCFHNLQWNLLGPLHWDTLGHTDTPLRIVNVCDQSTDVGSCLQGKCILYIILYYMYILYHLPMRFAANKFAVTLLFVDDDETWDTGAWITHLPWARSVPLHQPSLVESNISLRRSSR